MESRSRRTQGLVGGRSDRVVRAILDAAVAEVARSGYAGFRMEQVALEAQVNKTTIYRRWPNRASLIAALLQDMSAKLEERPLPDTGSIDTDLLEAFAHRSRTNRSVEGRAWARLLEERHNPEVESILGPTVEVRREEWVAMVTRAIDRAQLPPKTDPQLVFDLLRAILDSRRSDGLDVDWLTLAVRTVLAGARAGVLVSKGSSVSQEVQSADPRTPTGSRASRRVRNPSQR